MELVTLNIVFGIIVIGFIMLCVHAVMVNNKEKRLNPRKFMTLKDDMENRMLTKKGIKSIQKISYVGGFRDLLTKEDGTIEMYNDKFMVFLPSKEATILFKDMIDIEGMSETQMSKDVTLTRLLLVGVFAFGLKKTTESTRMFFTITYNELGRERKVIFESTGSQNIVRQYDAVLRENQLKSETVNEELEELEN